MKLHGELDLETSIPV